MEDEDIFDIEEDGEIYSDDDSDNFIGGDYGDPYDEDDSIFGDLEEEDFDEDSEDIETESFNDEFSEDEETEDELVSVVDPAIA